MAGNRSRSSWIRAVCLGFALLGLSSGAAQAQVTIDFERFPGPDGILGTADDTFPVCNVPVNSPCEPLGSHFASMGITFTSGEIFQGGFFPGSSLSNHYVSSSPPDATFSVPISGISITSFSFWTATLYALDEADNVIASNTLSNPNAGSGFFLGTLSVSANRPIRRFTVLAAGCQIGSPCDQILNLDNLVLTPAVAGSCNEDSLTMCLISGRYRVTSYWRNQYAGGALSNLNKTRLTDATGAFWIADANTYEYMIRFNTVTDNGRAWISIPMFTDVEFWIMVQDTVNGQSAVYHSPAYNRTLIYDPLTFVFP
jgi:hypothetical protein